ncbi:MAG: DDE-type integrase/transposase/recombinase [Patescibacteria group bacterium]
MTDHLKFDDSIPSIGQMAGLLAIDSVFGTAPVLCPRNERAEFVYKMLVAHTYQTCSRQDQGVIRKYLQSVTGYSTAQLSRHIAVYKCGRRYCCPYKRHTFPKVFTNADRELLAETDNAHKRMNGAATKKICKQMLQQGDNRFARLATISVSHLYNLRREERYQEHAVLTYDKTKPVDRKYGERRKPEPDGEPGYLRIDTVHQGDKDKEKGVYHINLVDEVTQWQVVLAVEGISETFLLPVLQEALRLFPFRIRNFHSDNGSEYINEAISKLLNKLLIKQTKSRPRHSNDNGLVESKNGSTIRKHMGHFHIPGKWAPRINTFYREHFIPYLNFHRPCAFPEKKILPNGKEKIIYKPGHYKTPMEKFLSLKKPSQYLRYGMTLKILQKEVKKKTSNQAAEEMQQSKQSLLQLIAKFINELPPKNLS